MGTIFAWIGVVAVVLVVVFVLVIRARGRRHAMDIINAALFLKMNESEGRALMSCAFSYHLAHGRRLDKDGLVLFGIIVKGVPGFSESILSGETTPVQALATIERMMSEVANKAAPVQPTVGGSGKG
jgi:hypothetical protein